MRDSAVVDPDFDAEVVETADRDERARPALILGVAVSLLAAVVASALAVVLSRRRHAGAAHTAPRAGPTSTIAVNWAFALFGSNVIGERPRRRRRLLALPGRR